MDTISMPFGFEQGDPLIVSINEAYLKKIASAFQLRAHYVLPLANIGGRRYDKIILHRRLLTLPNWLVFQKWLNETAITKLPPGKLSEIYWI